MPGGEVPPRRFEPPLPVQREAWHAACAAALVVWTRAAAVTRIGAPLGGEFLHNAAQLQRLAGRV